MYLNFEWLSSRLPKNSKIIVWAATVHTAKDLNAVAGFEGRLPLGSYIRRDFSDRAFSLGFSAYSGEYEFIHPPVKQLSRAPAASLEAQAFANRDFNVTFLPRKKLRKCGAVPGRLLGAGFSTARWDQVVDGLIVFRNERAPEWIHR
jgi:erythromycin esterase-like protein